MTRPADIYLRFLQLTEALRGLPSLPSLDPLEERILEFVARAAQTKDRLSVRDMMAKSELGTLIARNHDEIDQLRRLGERDYTEFTITGKYRPQKVANVTVELKGVNPKRNQFNLAMVVEDKRFEKKNRAANEPIFFYMTGTHIPEEIVINKIGKDTISGYVSVPKANQEANSTATKSGN